MKQLQVILFVIMAAVAATTSGADTFDSLPAWTPDANAERAEVPDVYKWNLGNLFADDEAWQTALDKARAGLAELSELHGKLEEAEALAHYLDAYFRLDEQINRVTLRANLARDAETTNQTLIANHQSALKLTNTLMEEGPVVRKAILDLDDSELAQAYAEVPSLQQFKPFIEGLRRRAGTVLGPEAERVLSLAGDNLWAQIDLNELPSASESAFAALLSDMPLPSITNENGESVGLTFSNYGRFRGSADRGVRRQAVTAMFATLTTYQNTLAATLVGQAKFDVFLAQARGYDTALEAYLNKDNIDTEVYRTLVSTVRENVAPLHRYIELRRKVMGIDSVHLYDLYIPLVGGVDREIPYPEGAKAILSALQPLGSDYIKQAQVALDPKNGWVDVYPSSTKQSGAFSAAVYGAHPYLKMNYQNSYNDMSTLAHELGHAMHSHLSMGEQSYQSWRYVSFLAEIASTCNEMLLSHYMVENSASDTEKAWILSELAESIRTTIYRQTMFAEFELKVHEMVETGEPVTADRLSETYADLVRAYYGPAYTLDEHDGIEWAYIPHFYWKYYVYNYATGLSSGIAMAERLRTGDTAARDAYLAMLAGGSERPPLEMLRSGGVDLTRPDAIESALRLLDRTLTELEQIMARLQE
ncbi:MAG: oligoendopeptidase F [bacterium]|nr:oligoendopeptidase F [bacterium]